MLPAQVILERGQLGSTVRYHGDLTVPKTHSK